MKSIKSKVYKIMTYTNRRKKFVFEAYGTMCLNDARLLCFESLKLNIREITGLEFERYHLVGNVKQNIREVVSPSAKESFSLIMTFKPIKM